MVPLTETASAPGIRRAKAAPPAPGLMSMVRRRARVLTTVAVPPVTEAPAAPWPDVKTLPAVPEFRVR